MGNMYAGIGEGGGAASGADGNDADAEGGGEIDEGEDSDDQLKKGLRIITDTSGGDPDQDEGAGDDDEGRSAPAKFGIGGCGGPPWTLRSRLVCTSAHDVAGGCRRRRDLLCMQARTSSRDRAARQHGPPRHASQRWVRMTHAPTHKPLPPLAHDHKLIIRGMCLVPRQINLLLAHPYGNSPQVAANNWTSSIVKDFQQIAERPWRDRGEDIADYFNYGFNEDTWTVCLGALASCLRRACSPDGATTCRMCSCVACAAVLYETAAASGRNGPHCGACLRLSAFRTALKRWADPRHALVRHC